MGTPPLMVDPKLASRSMEVGQLHRHLCQGAQQARLH